MTPVLDDGDVNAGDYHERRRDARLQDPVFRDAYEEAKAALEDPVSILRRCLLTWEASLGVTTARAPRERALIREMRDACNTIEGKDNGEHD